MCDYPPYNHVVLILCRGPHEARAEFALQTLARKLQEGLGDEVMVGEPTPAAMAKAHGQYRFQLMLRSTKVRLLSKHIQKAVMATSLPSDVTVVWDVDPVSLM